MRFLVYSILSALILFLGYKINLSRALAVSASVGILVLARGIKIFPYETVIFVMFINSLPFIADSFKRDVDRCKDGIRSIFEERKKEYEAIIDKDKRQIESNLEREKKLQQVLSLYEISKDMSSCLEFEDIFGIFSATLKKSFRFRISRLVLLKEPAAIDVVYQVELGARISKAAPDEFDRELARVMLETKKIISISPEENPSFMRRFSIIKNFETLVAVPLFAEEKIAGLLYIENIPRLYFENFIILVAQFAIQFQRVMLYEKVQEMSVTDSLTLVNTRRYFLERFREETRRSMRHKTNLSFLMLDMDHFKEKNDKFGHLVGDVILREVAAILKSNLREIDMIGRYGGEEFAIVLTGTGKDGALLVAERIRQGIEGAVFKAYDERVSTTVSIGISVFPDSGGDTNSLIEAADKALYKAKGSGRNRVC